MKRRIMLPTGMMQLRQDSHAHIVAHQRHYGFDGVQLQVFIHGQPQLMQSLVDHAASAHAPVEAQKPVAVQNVLDIPPAGTIGPPSFGN